MTTPTGTISLSDVNTELGYSATAQISLNDAAVRGLAGVASGAISMNDLRGKSNEFTFTISSNTTNANLRTLAVAAGWNQSSKVTATINSGVYVYSTSTGTPGLTINGSWPNGVTLVNNGYVMGMGGSSPTPVANTASAGAAGGSAISLGVNVTIQNNSYIAGGGGSGASARGTVRVSGGGGAGGGSAASGGAGGGPGSSGANGSASGGAGYGGGGGRILPGSGGASRDASAYPFYFAGLGGGAGGSGGCALNDPDYNNSAAAGGGGGWGAAGGRSAYNNSGTDTRVSGAGGSAGNAGSNYYQGGTSAAGGAGGKCVALNGYSVTWAATGTRYGAIS